MFQKILKTIVYAVVLLLCLLIVLRCCLNSDRSTLDDLVKTDALASVVSAEPGDKMAVRVLEDDASELSSDGYFCAYGKSGLSFLHNILTFYLSLGASGEKIPMTVVLSESRLMYEYRRLSLDGIELADDSVVYCWMELSGGVYSNTAVKYAEQPFVVERVRKPS